MVEDGAARPYGGLPSELKGLVLLLASPASSFMTGGAYLIDGGATLAGPGVQS